MATTLAGTFNPPSGWSVHNVTDISQASDADCIYNGASPAYAVGDQLVYDTTSTTYGWTVSIDSQGFPSLASSGDNRTDTFSYYAWDDTDNTWSSVGAYEITTTPTLSNATASAVTATTASISVDTDLIEGTIYAVITTSSTTPTNAQIKAGQSHLGASATWSGSDSATSATQTFAPSGLTAGTSYYAHFAQENAAATPLAATPVSSSAFSTPSAGSEGFVGNIYRSIAQDVARSIAR